MLASTETAGRAREIYNAGLNSAGVKWRCSPVTLSANVRTKVPAYIRAFGFLGHLIIKSRDYCSMSIKIVPRASPDIFDAATGSR